MRLWILALVAGGAYYAHTQGMDLWTAAGWNKLLGAASTASTQTQGAAPNAGDPNAQSSPGPVSSPSQVDSAPCCTGCAAGAPCASSAPATGAPVSSYGVTNARTF